MMLFFILFLTISGFSISTDTNDYCENYCGGNQCAIYRNNSQLTNTLCSQCEYGFYASDCCSGKVSSDTDWQYIDCTYDINILPNATLFFFAMTKQNCTQHVEFAVASKQGTIVDTYSDGLYNRATFLLSSNNLLNNNIDSVRIQYKNILCSTDVVSIVAMDTIHHQV